ncbi:hypothetical protein [Luteimonas aquatica]|nr:hypothetical protein [Luteimonas aquatica]
MHIGRRIRIHGDAAAGDGLPAPADPVRMPLAAMQQDRYDKTDVTRPA